jgi:iron uptake system EfeUOB component EfeO/EfeM
MAMRAPVALLCVLLLLGLAACGDKEKSSAPTTPATTAGESTPQTSTEVIVPPPATTLEEVPSQPVGPSGAVAAAKYRKYLTSRAAVLDAQTAKFAAALRRGDPETAVKTYANLRAAYERLQPIAVRLGLDTQMNAREGSVPASEWQGFHMIEKTIFESGMTGGTEAAGQQLAANAATIKQSIPSLEIDPAWILTDLNVALARAATNLAAEEEPYSHENLAAASGNTKTARVAWRALRPLVAASDPQLAREIDDAIQTAYITVESMLVPGQGYRRYDDISENDITAVVNAADAARAALIPAEQYLSN